MWPFLGATDLGRVTPWRGAYSHWGGAGPALADGSPKRAQVTAMQPSERVQARGQRTPMGQHWRLGF